MEETTPLYGFSSLTTEDEREREEKKKLKQCLLVAPFSNTSSVSLVHFNASLKFLVNCNYSIYADNNKKLLEVMDVNPRKEIKVTDRAIYFTCTTDTARTFQRDQHSRALYCKINSSPMSGQILRVYPLKPLTVRTVSSKEPVTVQLDVTAFSWDKHNPQFNNILCFKATKDVEGDITLTERKELPLIRQEGVDWVDIQLPRDESYSVGTTSLLFTTEPLLEFFSYHQEGNVFFISHKLVKQIGSLIVLSNPDPGL